MLLLVIWCALYYIVGFIIRCMGYVYRFCGLKKVGKWLIVFGLQGQLYSLREFNDFILYLYGSEKE